jgi:hypothetical protein
MRNERRFIGQPRSGRDQSVCGDSSHKRRFVMSSFPDEFRGGTSSPNVTRFQFRNTSPQAVNLVDPCPFKANGPAGFARSEALAGNGSDRRLCCRRRKTRQVLIDVWIPQGVAKAGRPHSGRLLQLPCQRGNDIFTAEHCIEDSWFIAPAAPHEPSVEKV